MARRFRNARNAATWPIFQRRSDETMEIVRRIGPQQGEAMRMQGRLRALYEGDAFVGYLTLQADSKRAVQPSHSRASCTSLSRGEVESLTDGLQSTQTGYREVMGKRDRAKLEETRAKLEAFNPAHARAAWCAGVTA